MRYLSLSEVLELRARIIGVSGGAAGIRDLPALESAIAQPRITFEAAELYPDLAGKAAAQCHSLVCNHPFVDGNKRVGHAAMETFLVLNGYEIRANIDEQEQFILTLAAGEVSREDLTAWVREYMKEV